MSTNIIIGKLQDGGFVGDWDIDIDAFVSADQNEMPTPLAEAINYSIAFTDSVSRDFGVSDITIGLVPEEDDCGDLGIRKILLDISGDRQLEVHDSMLFTAYLAVSGIQAEPTLLGGTIPQVVVSPLVVPDRSYEVTITVNNDETKEIYDVTQSRLIVKEDDTSPRWSLGLVGSYDIDRDKFFTVDGEKELTVERIH